MKKTCLNFLLAGSMIIAASCGNNNNSTDSKATATDENKDKFDSTAILADAKFAVSAADGGVMEVKLGELALINCSSSSVKKLGQMMIDDHGKANTELMGVAKTKNITIPDKLSDKCQSKYDDMAKKKGVDFDKAYVDLMMKDHKDAIDDFKKESEKGKDTDLRKWAADKLPTLEHHLMEVQSADSIVNKKL